jgi:predicted ATP-grasp superfamily ATP-dependent carboligase
MPADAALTASPAAGIAVEGRAMLAALLRDVGRDPAFAVELLLDRRLAPESLGPLPPGTRVVVVEPGGDLEALRRGAARCERTVVVAPEDDGLLEARVAAVRGAGGVAVACDGGFIRLAADKQATAAALAGRGVPVPAGRALRPGDPFPTGFHLPAVAKARAACGGAGFALVRAAPELPPAAGERRLEAFVAGEPVGVSCLCGPAGVLALPPVRQRSVGTPPRFVGGDFALAPGPAGRAAALAVRAVRALEAPGRDARGWVGVDMILAPREDGLGDRVLEVNPRLTTSFTGLARRGRGSLLGAMIALADGRPPPPGWDPSPLGAPPAAFDALA